MIDAQIDLQPNNILGSYTDGRLNLRLGISGAMTLQQVNLVLTVNDPDF